MARTVYIVGAARTPIGRFGGSMLGSTAVEIGGTAIRGALANTGVPAEAVEFCVMGHARQAGNGPNPGRLMALAGGLPVTAPTYSTQMACLSGFLAVHQAASAILEGEAEVAVAGGSEHMSSIPHLASGVRWGTRMGDTTLTDALHKDGFMCPINQAHMGKLCDNMAREQNISREDQDAFALRSQQLTAQAQDDGRLARMIVPVEIPGRKGPTTLSEDETPRRDTSAEGLARLKPAFVADGSITPGNAPGICDGAAALVLASEEAVRRHDLTPLARIVGHTMAALDPKDAFVAPVAAGRRLAARLEFRIQDADHYEFNEAFAAMMLATIRQLELDQDKVNTWGGAVALGHPIGMSGTRIIQTLAQRLVDEGGRYGVAGICGNGGHGGAMLLERA